MVLKSCVNPKGQNNKHVLPMWIHNLTIGQTDLQIGGKNPINLNTKYCSYFPYSKVLKTMAL